MKKDRAMKQVAELLEDSGYSLVIIRNMHTCMDILAKRLDRKFVIKVVYNVDSASREEADTLNKVASFMDAEPLIVGSVSKRNKLAEGVDYNRFSVRCVSINSMDRIASNLPSLTASKSIGVTALVDGAKLRYLRKLNNMTRSKLSRSAKISKDTIYMHESQGGYAAIRTIEQIERVLNGTITASEQNVRSTAKVGATKLANTGIKAIKLSNAPFDIIAKSSNYYEISGDANIRTMVKRAEFFKTVRESFEDNYPFFLSKNKKGRLHGVPVLNKKDLKRISSEHELLEELTY